MSQLSPNMKIVDVSGGPQEDGSPPPKQGEEQKPMYALQVAAMKNPIVTTLELQQMGQIIGFFTGDVERYMEFIPKLYRERSELGFDPNTPSDAALQDVTSKRAMDVFVSFQIVNQSQMEALAATVNFGYDENKLLHFNKTISYLEIAIRYIRDVFEAFALSISEGFINKHFPGMPRRELRPAADGQQSEATNKNPQQPETKEIKREETAMDQQKEGGATTERAGKAEATILAESEQLLLVPPKPPHQFPERMIEFVEKAVLRRSDPAFPEVPPESALPPSPQAERAMFQRLAIQQTPPTTNGGVAGAGGPPFTGAETLAAAAAAAPGGVTAALTNEGANVVLTQPKPVRDGKNGDNGGSGKPGDAKSPRKFYPFGRFTLAPMVRFVETWDGKFNELVMGAFLEALMASAMTLWNDPLVFSAVNQWTLLNPQESWAKVDELYAHCGVHLPTVRELFEVICLVRKYINATVKSRKLLLAVTGRILEDIKTQRAAKPESFNASPQLPSALNEAKSTLQALRGASMLLANAKEPTANGDEVAPTEEDLAQLRKQVETHHTLLMYRLRVLFLRLIGDTKKNLSFIDSYETCSERCRCSFRLKNAKIKPRGDIIEKIKLMDIFVCDLIRRVSQLKEGLLVPTLEGWVGVQEKQCLEWVKYVQNGELTVLRLRLFYVSTSVRLSVTDDDFEDVFESQLLQVRVLLSTVYPGRFTALTRATEVALNQLYELRSVGPNQRRLLESARGAFMRTLPGLFFYLCDPELQLCVHSPLDTDKVPGAAPHFYISRIGTRPQLPQNVFLRHEACLEQLAFMKLPQLDLEAAEGKRRKKSDEPPPEDGDDAVTGPVFAPPGKDDPMTKWRRKGLIGPNRGNIIQCGYSKCEVINRGELRRCTNCKVQFYCSPNCQKSHWDEHRKVCKGLSLVRIGESVNYRQVSLPANVAQALTDSAKLRRDGNSPECPAASADSPPTAGGGAVPSPTPAEVTAAVAAAINTPQSVPPPVKIKKFTRSLYPTKPCGPGKMLLSDEFFVDVALCGRQEVGDSSNRSSVITLI